MADMKGSAPVWVVENKADLVPAANDGSVGKNESQSINRINDSLTMIRNEALTSGASSRNEQEFEKNELKIGSSGSSFRLSAETGDGVPALLSALAAQATDFLGAGEPALLTRERHRDALETVLAALRRALAEPAATREDIIAEELRLAATALGKLTGRIDVEDVLDVIFRDFCIGK
jgi:tRNA U34 5-carboxymethylaminomethyl modifying GTPase MnmE/TrmE